MLILTWIFVAAIVIAAIATVILHSPQLRLQPARSKPLPTLLDLGIGDIVQHLDQDWIVEDKLTYSSHGYCWNEYLLQDGEEQRWLSIDQDDELIIHWLCTTTQIEIPRSMPDRIEIAEISYFLNEQGTAQMTRASRPDRSPEPCRYWDYSNQNHVLCVERWGEDLEVSIGHKLRHSQLTVLKGNGQRIYGV